MEELKELFHKVRGVKASCRMDTKQMSDYEELNKQYKKLSGSNTNYSVCSKGKLLKAVESFIDASND